MKKRTFSYLKMGLGACFLLLSSSQAMSYNSPDQAEINLYQKKLNELKNSKVPIEKIFVKDYEKIFNSFLKYRNTLNPKMSELVLSAYYYMLEKLNRAPNRFAELRDKVDAVNVHMQNLQDLRSNIEQNCSKLNLEQLVRLGNRLLYEPASNKELPYLETEWNAAALVIINSCLEKKNDYRGAAEVFKRIEIDLDTIRDQELKQDVPDLKYHAEAVWIAMKAILDDEMKMELVP